MNHDDKTIKKFSRFFQDSNFQFIERLRKRKGAISYKKNDWNNLSRKLRYGVDKSGLHIKNDFEIARGFSLTDWTYDEHMIRWYYRRGDNEF